MIRKLGRGLDSLIEDSTEDGPDAVPAGASVPVSAIAPNPFQPRKEFEATALAELTASIREHGVLQPLVVRSAGTGFELVAGERRLRAAREAGLESVPVVVREEPDERMLELALVENLQREDLNPIDKAEAYRRYLDELSLTHQQAADRLGKSRTAVTNQLRLLELAEDVQAMVSRGTLSMGHARALLGIEDAELRREVALLVERDGLSVRDVERAARKERSPAPAAPAPGKAPAEKSAHLQDLERLLRERFATKARIDGSKDRGRVTLEYASMEELGRLLDLLLPDAEL